MNQFQDPKRQAYNSFVGVFVRDGCPHCRLYMEFIERLNSSLPLPKRVRVINCTIYDKYGIVTDPIIPVFADKFDSYPTLFVHGLRKVGSNSVEELIAWSKSFFARHFLIDEQIFTEANGGYYPFRFEKNCQRIKKGIWGSKIQCA